MKDPSLPKEILRSAQNKNASGIRLRVNRLSWNRTEKERAGQNARLFKVTAVIGVGWRALPEHRCEAPRKERWGMCVTSPRSASDNRTPAWSSSKPVARSSSTRAFS